MQMRRSERSLTSIDAITSVLDQCLIMRLGLIDHGGPYVVPMHFAHLVRGGQITVYAHGAPDGRKLAAIKANPRCCVEVDHLDGLVDDGTGPCGLGAHYQSVIGFGDARVVNDPVEARNALALLVQRQAPDQVDALPEVLPSQVVIIAVDLETVTGKAC